MVDLPYFFFRNMRATTPTAPMTRIGSIEAAEAVGALSAVEAGVADFPVAAFTIVPVSPSADERTCVQSCPEDADAVGEDDGETEATDPLVRSIPHVAVGSTFAFVASVMSWPSMPMFAESSP